MKRRGRPTELDERVRPVTLTLDPMTVRKLRVLGEGNISKGVRKAADVAYDRYQKDVGPRG